MATIDTLNQTPENPTTAGGALPRDPFATFPAEFWDWLRSQEASTPGINAAALANQSQAYQYYQAWLSQTGGDGTDTGVTPPSGETPPPDETGPPADPTATEAQKDAYELLLESLNAWGLGSLAGWAWEAILAGKSYQQVILELRQLPEYKAAFPENDLRAANGFSFMPEKTILESRDKFKEIAWRVSGMELSNNDIAKFLANDRSVLEFEETMLTWERFKKWGPTVRGVLEEELGQHITDDRLWAILSNDTTTTQEDTAYENALYRGRPAILGLGIRPEEEADLLRRYGVDVDQAFRGYQGIVNEMPRAEKLQAIEKALTGNSALPTTGSALFNDTPFSLLFRAVQLGDATAIRELQRQMDLDVARQMAGGAAQFSGGVAGGLLTQSQRTDF